MSNAVDKYFLDRYMPRLLTRCVLPWLEQAPLGQLQLQLKRRKSIVVLLNVTRGRFSFHPRWLDGVDDVSNGVVFTIINFKNYHE